MRLCLISLSIILTLVLIEVAANFYLWNIADEATFKYYASSNQYEERYGESAFGTIERNGFSLVAENYLGYVTQDGFQSDVGNRHNSLGFRGDDEWGGPVSRCF